MHRPLNYSKTLQSHIKSWNSFDSAAPHAFGQNTPSYLFVKFRLLPLYLKQSKIFVKCDTFLEKIKMY
jgi:hypothetical protein